MTINGVSFDKQKIFHDISLAYAQFELQRTSQEEKFDNSPQGKLNFLITEYCQALGICQGFTDEFMRNFISKEWH